jgi:tetratricopeptide (TPR) repeat protein
LFAGTGAYTAAYNHRRSELGKEWFSRGISDLQNGHADAAIEQFRTAVLYAPESREYRLRLAEALVSANRTSEALDDYRSLWQSAPEDGSVNLQLARLAARTGNKEDAERFFNGAIFGLWNEHARENRREALFEMIDFYLQHNDYGSADSQLAVLASNLPDDLDLHERVGALFLQVNDNVRAREQFLNVLGRKPQDPMALRGAAEAEFRLGNYASARPLLEQLVRMHEADPGSQQHLETIRDIVSLDAFQPRIGSEEKARRLIRGFQLAGERLSACAERLHSAQSAQPANLADLSVKWMSLAPLDERKLRANNDLADEIGELTYDIEKQTSSFCGDPPSGPDLALLILARKRASANP